MTITAPNMSLTAAAGMLPVGLERVVLIGFMGAGKTSVGRLLAEAVGCAFVDLDGEVERRVGASVAEIFRTEGEPRFRQLETVALASALGRTGVVLALGGGAPEQLRNRLLLEQTAGTLIVFLDAPFPMLYDRCMLQSFASPDHIRPVLASPAEAEARFQTRQPVYRRLARIAVMTAGLTPAEVAEAVAVQVHGNAALVR